MMNYVGNKGYTIYKSNLKTSELEEIKKELTVAPFSPIPLMKPQTFPVYRESKDKLYVPRFFGLDKYSSKENVKLDDGETIDLIFNGSLRDYQYKIINSFLNKVETTRSGGLLEIPCGRGKTVMALNIIAQLKKKTLVIVHKGFLLNQWIERIKYFLPNARIGTIQGTTIDIDDKDIVLGMLQSLSMKDYPSSVFSSFGLTIIDEVHHIAAEVFVRSLFKIVSPIMLGLSATMNRKDGLSFVFKMFLGPVVYKEKRDTEDNVLVKKFDFHDDDPDYSNEVTDYRGNIQYSTMISKLCNNEHRSNFIIEIVRDLLKNDTKNKEQLIILGHNKSLLNYLYDVIKNNNIASVGYYLGGMKEASLKESETKKIVIGTYSMASEALDIPSLTILIMATPKTDIEQSVGRILRTKHSQPQVIDIVDQHDVFKKQFKKRMTFYKKQNYKVVQYTSSLKMEKVLYEPDSSKTKSVLKKDNAESVLEQLDPHTTSTASNKRQCFINLSAL